ncbi:MAG: hypothetical protein PVI90_01080 [Desulfobacteraceae bacterium]|jgi:hypothetical protein
MTYTQTYDPVTYRSGTRKGITSTIFSSNIPHRAPLLCYIAGIECPIVAATVSYGVWKIPEANISMFPDPQLQRFGTDDRVPVVIFYLDEYIDPVNPTWCMLFEGEIVGWGYTNTPLGRSIQFSCVMDIAVWTQLFLFYMTTLNGVATGATVGQQTGEQINQATPVYPYALFRKGLVPETDTGYIERPFDLAYNVIRGLISDAVPDYMRCVPAVNFFSRWVRRQQFHNKWVALPFLDEQSDVNGKKLDNQAPGIFPILRAAQSQQAVEALHKHVAKEMSGASIYTMLKRILDIVFMEIVMLPTPVAVTTSLTGSILGAPRFLNEAQREAFQQKESAKALEESEAYADAFGITSPQSVRTTVPKHIIDPTKPIRLTNYFIKPQMFFGLPPVCNVIFPSMVQQISYKEDYITQPTRLYFQDDAMVDLLTENSQAQNNDYLLSTLARAYPPEIDKKFGKDAKKRANPSENAKNILLYPEEFFKGPVTARYPAPPWLMYFASVGKGSGQTTGTKTGDSTNKSVTPVEGESITDQDVYTLYAQYEYYRQRYMQRGGAIECAFNPYVVPGFPMIAFDDFQTKMHIVGYLMNVTHQFSAGGVQTSLNFSYGRTIYEFFNDVANEIDNPALESREGFATAAAPPEPIPEIRNIVQHFDRADQFYQALFFMRPEAPKRPAVFQYRDILAIAKSDGTLEDIFIEGKNEERIAQEKPVVSAALTLMKELQDTTKGKAHLLVNNKLSTKETQKYIDAVDLATDNNPDKTYSEIFSNRFEQNRIVFLLEAKLRALENPTTTHNLNTAVPGDIVPRPSYEPYFDSYDAAMRYCSRPICTLEKYIAFINGVREGVRDDVAYDDGSTIRSARYYDRIRYLKGATESTTTTVSEEQQGLFGAKAAEAVSEDFPQMRAEWDRILLAYRARIYAAIKVRR